MKNIVGITILLINSICYSQVTFKGKVLYTNEKGNEEAVPGVSVFWLNTQIGTITNDDGTFRIPRNKANSYLIISHIGFKTDTLLIQNKSYLRYVLKEKEILEEVEIIVSKEPTQRSFLDAQNIMNIGNAELLKAACCNLSESFETNPSIDVNFSDALTGTKQIQMLGLKSPYLLITQENIPSVRGASQVFGLTFTPGSWVESIQITKGAGSITNGYESISGQINAELIKPFSDSKFFTNFYGELGGRLELNTHFNQKLSDKWYTGFYLHGSNRSLKFDRNNDGFLDNPLTNQVNIMNRWQYIDSEKGWIGFVNLRYLNDTKQTGQIFYDFKKRDKNLQFWGSEINTSKAAISTKLGYVFPDLPFQKFSFQMSYNDHQQKSYFGLKDYDIYHKSFYVNGLFSSIIGDTRHQFKVGASFLQDDYFELVIDKNFKRKEHDLGVFFEYTYDDNEFFSLTAGIRLDFHNLLGAFLTPRVHARYAAWNKGVFKASIGRGVRSANIFAENLQLFASSRSVNIQSNKGKIYGVNPEIAWNAGVSFSQRFRLIDRKGSISIDYYKTVFQNKVIVDWENLNAISFYDLKGESKAESFQVEITQNVLPYFNIRLAYRLNNVKTDYESGRFEKPLLARNRFFVNTSYETISNNNGAQWKFDFTYNWLGNQRIPGGNEGLKSRGLASYSKPYSTINAQVTKVFSKTFEVYLGAENITDVRQDVPIQGHENPFGTYFDTTIVYAPIFGSNYYTGLRIKLD